MNVVALAIVLLLAAGTGAAYVRFLTVHPLRMSRYLLLTCVLTFAALVLTALSFTDVSLVITTLAALAAFVLGYLLMARHVLSREDERPVPALAREAGDPGLGHTAVVYFTHGEPELYDPIGWLNQFREFDEQKIAFVPLIARPFFIHHLRNSYLRVGRSEHRRTHQRTIKALEASYRARGDATTRFYLSFLDDNPRPDAALIQALNEGASRIIVAEVFVSDSNHTLEGKELIEAVHAETLGVPVTFSGPLWDSATLHSLFVQRANAHLDDVPKAQTGVLLVGHGQPAEWDVYWPTETEHEIAFRQHILDSFERDGYKRENLSLAWMEFKEPKPAPKIEGFLRTGVQRILYFSAAISADSLHSQYDVPALVSQARNPRGVSILNLGAWNDDPIAVRAIMEKIDACMAGTADAVEARDSRIRESENYSHS
jgi:sirohydrochlorin ferrochelatase